MSKIKFKPWVGKKYKKGINGKKVLILGESHYGTEENKSSKITINVVKKMLDYSSEFEPWMNTFTRFSNSFAGKSLSQSEKSDFWNSVIFYNYVQFLIGDVRESPTKTQFEESEKAFFDLLKKYKPDLIIAWGNRLYENMPTSGSALPEIELSDGSKINGWQYPISKNKTVKVLPICHPSAPVFKNDYWHEAISIFLS